MSDVVNLRLIGTADQVWTVVQLLSAAATGTGVRVVSDPSQWRGVPERARVYVDVVLPAGLPDMGVR